MKIIYCGGNPMAKTSDAPRESRRPQTIVFRSARLTRVRNAVSMVLEVARSRGSPSRELDQNPLEFGGNFWGN